MLTPVYIYRARCVRVIDGDTYLLLIDLGLRVRAEVEIRLNGWSCPERNTPNGMQAMFAAQEWLIGQFGMLTEWPLIVQTFKDQRSFARWIADVYTRDYKSEEPDDVTTHVGELLARDGHASRTMRIRIDE